MYEKRESSLEILSKSCDRMWKRTETGMASNSDGVSAKKFDEIRPIRPSLKRSTVVEAGT
jgi:hypothetical protein